MNIFPQNYCILNKLCYICFNKLNNMKDKIQIMEMLIEAYKHDGNGIEKLKPISQRLHAMWNECVDNMKTIDTLTAEIQNITFLECEKILTPLKSI